jgi:hypothetical protein
MTTKTTASQLANVAALATHATEIRALGKRAFDDIVEIGRRLIEAKKICGHGNWLPWLEREFGWKEQSARNFMNVAEMAGKSPTVGDLSIDCRGLYLLAAPSTPAVVIEAVVERGERVTAAQVRELVEAYKPGQKPAAKDAPARSSMIRKPTIDRGDPNRVWPKLSEAARDLGQRMIAVGPVYRSIIEHWSGEDRVAFTRLMRDTQKALEADRSLEALLEHVEAELAKGTQAAAQPADARSAPTHTPPSAKTSDEAKAAAAPPQHADEDEADDASEAEPKPHDFLRDRIDWENVLCDCGFDMIQDGDKDNDHGWRLCVWDRAKAVAWFKTALADWVKAAKAATDKPASDDTLH